MCILNVSFIYMTCSPAEDPTRVAATRRTRTGAGRLVRPFRWTADGRQHRGGRDRQTRDRQGHTRHSQSGQQPELISEQPELSGSASPTLEVEPEAEAQSLRAQRDAHDIRHEYGQETVTLGDGHFRSRSLAGA